MSGAGSASGGTDPDPGTEALLARLADKVVRLHMSVPAILFLEGMKPLNFVGSQTLAFFEPMARTMFAWKDMEKLRVALEHRGTIERLIVLIEAGEARRRGGPPGKEAPKPK